VKNLKLTLKQEDTVGQRVSLLHKSGFFRSWARLRIL